MTEEKMSPLRQRMIENMRIRGMGDKHQKSHIRAIKDFAAFRGRSPDTATPEDLRAYQLHMTDAGVTPSTFNTRIVALRFFFGMTCGREEMKRYMQFRTEPRKLPVVFSVEEVSDILMAAPGPGLQYRAALSISYGAGLTHHPHIHIIVPGGGLSPGGSRWIACRPGFFLHLRVLARLFRRLFLEGLMDLHHAGKLTFFGDLAGLSDAKPFAAWLAPFRIAEWVVYAKPPFGGPKAVLAYLSRYTHRVAISNTRLVSADVENVAFRWKDYRIKSGIRQKVMRLATQEFIRRFLIHVLPDGFHRIRHYGLLANTTRKANIRNIRALLCVLPPEQVAAPETEPEIAPLTLREPCPCCGGPMRIIEIFRRGQKPMSRAPPREQAA
ncbi:transposase [Thioclava sp.]|uniref:IS91 family transposase n=1 Tax=Thioclava sp. TaxID=1933450 RepID=UPI003AA8FC9D